MLLLGHRYQAAQKRGPWDEAILVLVLGKILKQRHRICIGANCTDIVGTLTIRRLLSPVPPDGTSSKHLSRQLPDWTLVWQEATLYLKKREGKGTGRTATKPVFYPPGKFKGHENLLVHPALRMNLLESPRASHGLAYQPVFTIEKILKCHTDWRLEALPSTTRVLTAWEAHVPCAYSAVTK